MLFPEVNLKRVIVDIVLLFASLLSPIANVAPFVLVAAMNIELIVPIKSSLTESTVWMPLESALVDGSWIIVAELLVFPKLLRGK